MTLIAGSGRQHGLSEEVRELSEQANQRSDPRERDRSTASPDNAPLKATSK